jgi:hypothetical protein
VTATAKDQPRIVDFISDGNGIIGLSVGSLTESARFVYPMVARHSNSH